MNLLNIIRPIAFSSILLACAGIAAAQSTSSSSELAMSATVQTAVRLDIATNGGAAVTPAGAGAFSISFGNVNGLGIGTPASNVAVVADSTGALYTTPISVTPVYSGFTSETATLEVEQDGSGDTTLAREGETAITTTNPSSAGPVEFADTITSGTPTTRFVGFYVPRVLAAGSMTANLIYTVTVD